MSTYIAWTTVPLFLNNSLHPGYLLDGYFRLPLYAGALPATMTADMI